MIKKGEFDLAAIGAMWEILDVPRKELAKENRNNGTYDPLNDLIDSMKEIWELEQSSLDK